MEYTVKQLAELSGVSPRTLRYYDAIGLLHPARVTAAGYRIYGSYEVDLLQQILLYRSLEFPLETIGRLLRDPEFDRLAALREQRQRLAEQQSRLRLLLETVDRTIAQETGGISMKDDEKFAALKREALAENERLYGAEIRKKYGNPAIDDANHRFGSLNEAELREMEALGEHILRGLEEAVRRGEPPAGAQGRMLARLHRRWLGFVLPSCTAAMQRGLCEMYLADPRFTAYYDKNIAGCAQFLHDAAAALPD